MNRRNVASSAVGDRPRNCAGSGIEMAADLFGMWVERASEGVVPNSLSAQKG